VEADGGAAPQSHHSLVERKNWQRHNFHEQDSEFIDHIDRLMMFSQYSGYHAHRHLYTLARVQHGSFVVSEHTASSKAEALILQSMQRLQGNTDRLISIEATRHTPRPWRLVGGVHSLIPGWSSTSLKKEWVLFAPKDF
jgi:hypothetical protein